MAEIQLKHVYKKYDDGVTADSDFNLQIEDKEFVIFVGPSGCGKSTTLRMIAGLEEISQGELFIDGKQMNHVPSCDRDIAMVFQNYALYPHMTVAENMAYSMRLKGVSKKDRRKKVEEVAQILGLSQVLDRKPAELSGGQKQRVAMGRAIVRHPKAFLMDEPLSNLDAKLRNQMRVEIMKLYRQLDTTFIYVTHDQTEAMTLGTKLVVMKAGEIQQIATPEELYNEPANLFVASFIGVPQMNFFHGKCGIDKEKHAVVRVEGQTFHVSEDLEKRIYEKGYMGEEVIVGIRPEDMVVLPDESEEGLEAKINVYEMLGAEAYLYFDCNGESRAIRIEAESKIRKGDRVRYTFQEERIHLFDPRRENRI